MLHVAPVVNDELLVLIYCNRKILTIGAGDADVDVFLSLKPARQRHVLDARVAATNGVMQHTVQRHSSRKNEFLVIVLT